MGCRTCIKALTDSLRVVNGDTLQVARGEHLVGLEGARERGQCNTSRGGVSRGHAYSLLQPTRLINYSI